jgi:ABC-2 type transport system permease protein
VNLDPQSIRVIAEKDFRDAIRSRALLVLGTVFIVFFAVAAFLFADQFGQLIDSLAASNNTSDQQAAAQAREQLNSNRFLGLLTQITRLLIPLTAIVVSYAALVGERESGTLKLLLSLPHSRANVVVGKFFGRSSVVAVPVLVGFLVAAPVFPIAGVPFQPVGFAAFALATALLAVLFVALSVGASAAAPTSRRAVVFVVGLYALFTLLWGQFSNAIYGQIQSNTELGQVALVKAFLVIRHLNPVRAYESLVASVGQTGPLAARLSLVGGLQGQIFTQVLQDGGGLPFYLTDGALVVYLLLWVAVSVSLGLLAFEKLDL